MFPAPRGKTGEVEEGNAIYCCALGKQGNPWGISTNITQKPADVLSDFGFKTKVSVKDAKSTCPGCMHGCAWILLCLDKDGLECSPQHVLWLEHSHDFSFVHCLMVWVSISPSCSLIRRAALACDLIGTPEVQTSARHGTEVNSVKALVWVSVI